MVERVGLELASVFLEVQTGVYESGDMAIAEVLAIRKELNYLLEKRGAQLVFVPVSTREFEFVPSSEEAGSRSAELVARWGKSAAGRENLIASSIASLQINDSRPFKNAKTIDELLEIGKKVHNHCRLVLPLVYEQLVSDYKDFRGKTRLENYETIVMRVEAEKFLRHGFQKKDAVIPPYFNNVEQMRRWMCAYSDCDNFENTNPKDEHAVTCKIKRPQDAPWIVEVRYPDAVDTESAMLRAVTMVENILKQVYEAKGTNS